MNSIPWVEIYRPRFFDDIILDSSTKRILQNIVSNGFPVNMLLYGPPGTGKTSTILSMINTYQHTQDSINNASVMHLNASDDRGVDIIRNKLSTFVRSNTLFTNTMKIIVLDEVDYMTKLAQNALKQIIEKFRDSVRFVLICNYMSKIDSSLQNMFVKIRFNSLPNAKILKHLKNICTSENIRVSNSQLRCIMEHYQSDIRSMINHIQLNNNADVLVGDNYFAEITRYCQEAPRESVASYIDSICASKRISPRQFWTKYFYRIICERDPCADHICNIESVLRMDISDKPRWNKCASEILLCILNPRDPSPSESKTAQPNPIACGE